MAAELIAIVSAMGWAVDAILVRRGSERGNVLSAAFLSYLVTAACLWFYLALSFSLSILASKACIYFMLSGTLQPLLARILFYMGLERLGVARTTPLRGTGPLFSVLIAVLFLHERPALSVYFGAVFIVAAGWLVLYRKHTSTSDWRLIHALFPIGAAFFAGVSQNLRRAGLLILPNPALAAAVTTSTSLALFTVYLSSTSRARIMVPNPTALPYFVPAAFISAFSQLLVFVSLSLGEVSVVIPLLNTTPLFSVFFSALFLRDLERVTVNIVIGVFLMMAGAILIASR